MIPALQAATLGLVLSGLALALMLLVSGGM
jgi:hypothetical protein